MRRSIIVLVLVLPLAFTCGKDDDDGGGGSSSGGTGTTQTGTGDTSSGGTSSGDTSSGGTSSSGDTTSGSSGTSGTGSGTTSSLCGNNTIDQGEDCDGTDLGGETCESLGEGTGELGCDPVMCTYDTSMCTGNGSSTSGG